MITRKRFENALNKIGWSILKSHNGANDWIVNAKGKRTMIRVLNSRIDICNMKYIFGSEYQGSINYEFKDCFINVTKDNECFTLCTAPVKDKQNGNFMQFYNHEK